MTNSIYSKLSEDEVKLAQEENSYQVLLVVTTEE